MLPVLVYGSELRSLTVAEEQRLKVFYMRCLRTIIGVFIVDRMKNDLVLQLTGQPPLENILRRNRLGWFGHVNRMNNDQNSPMLTKKTLFVSFKDEKRPPYGVNLRWRDKIMKDINVSNIKNWRRETQDKNKWRKTINHGVTCSIVHTDTTSIVREHKEKAMNPRARETSSHQIKQNTTRPISNDMAPTNDDAKCTQCGNVCVTICEIVLIVMLSLILILHFLCTHGSFLTLLHSYLMPLLLFRRLIIYILLLIVIPFLSYASVSFTDVIVYLLRGI